MWGHNHDGVVYRGTTTNYMIEVCGYLKTWASAWVLLLYLLLGPSIYIIAEHVYTRMADKNACLDSSAVVLTLNSYMRVSVNV